MFARNHLVLCIVGLFLGCNQPSIRNTAEKPTDDEPTLKFQPKEPEAIKAEYTHVIVTETEYYTTGPQQGRPPDGTFQAGTKVTLVEETGSYLLVNAKDGTQGYVAADALEQMKQNSTSEEKMAAIVTGNNQFAVDLYAQLRGGDGNLFFSPSSISTALAMTYAGARGTTEIEMAKALHFDLPQDQIHHSFAALNKTLNPKDKPYELSVANRLWGQQGYGFLPAFLQTTRDHYGAELAQVDFLQAAEAARQEINGWVADQTNDKIRDLIPQGVLNEMTRLVLTNATYFLGTWEHQFNKDATHDAPFKVTAEVKVDVPMMYQKAQFRYAEVDEVLTLELPYKGDDLSMIVLLPKAVGGLAALEDKLVAENLKKWTSGLRRQKVNVHLPKFKMTSEFQLNAVLSSMGMATAFQPVAADFSGISTEEELFISAVIHKAFVDVNEEGTEAAAATGIAFGTTSLERIPTFRADHPFIFLIRDNRTDSILFMGRFMNPRS